MSRLLRIAFWAALIFAFVMAVLPHPPQLPGAPTDKIQHILAFTTLGLLAPLAYRDTALLRIGLLLSAFGALIEIVQAIPILYRDADVVDWAADTAALAVVLSLAALWRSAQKARRRPGEEQG
jgi:VanZ family protein